MPASVRLDAKSEELVARMARNQGQTKSEIIRKAIKVLAETQDNRGKTLRPFDAIAHLIGCARGGPRDLSERTGEKFRQLLAKKGCGR